MQDCRPYYFFAPLLGLSLARRSQRRIVLGAARPWASFGDRFRPHFTRSTVTVGVSKYRQGAVSGAAGSSSAKGPVYDIEFTIKSPEGKEFPRLQF